MNKINKHLVKGFTYAFPFIVLYSITLAINQFLYEIDPVQDYIFLLIVPALTIGITSSMYKYTLILPALVLGYAMHVYGLSFLGGILGGLLLGYTYLWFLKNVPTTNTWMLYLLYPMVSFLIVYVGMRYVVSVPVLYLLDTIREWVLSINQAQTLLLVGILSFLMVIDLGGPFNKLSFTLTIELYVLGWYAITGPVVLAVAIPPMGILLSVYLYQFRMENIEPSIKRLLLFGSVFGMTESALPVVLKDPLKRIPIVVTGSVVASIFAASFGLSNVLLMSSIPGLFGVNKIGIYLLSYSIGIGLIVGLFGLALPKKQLNKTENPL